MQLYKILIIGKHGQLAQCLDHQLRFTDNSFASHFQIYFTHRQELDIGNYDNCIDIIHRFNPHIIINTAAYKEVDKAESDSELAIKVNEKGAENLALICKDLNIPLIHLSTDYVFDGNHQIPYTPDDHPNPLNVYGKTKLAGENAIRSIWAYHVIIRTSWLFSPFGHNFVTMMLHKAKQEPILRIVNDQHGCPTAGLDLANTLIHLIKQILIEKKPVYGIFHCTNHGITTWYDFAVTIFHEWSKITMQKMPILEPVSTSFFKAPAKRPLYSALSTEKIYHAYGIQFPFWENSLLKTLQNLKNTMK